MAGGTFIEGQTKQRPGLYINFKAAALARVGVSERGVTILPMILDWGNKGELIRVDNDDLEIFKKEFSRDISESQLLYLRLALQRAKTVIVYCLNSGNKASKTWGTVVATATAKKQVLEGIVLV